MCWCYRSVATTPPTSRAVASESQRIGGRNAWDGFPARCDAIPLADELVEFVDELVDSGAERSRAAVVSRALERERRRAVAARDAEILARTGADPDLAGLAEHMVGQSSELA